MQQRDIAGIEPAIGIHRIGFGAEIALHDPRPANLETPGDRSVARQFHALVIDDAQFDPERHRTLAADDVQLRVAIEIVPIRPRRERGGDRRGFGHPPQMRRLDAEIEEPAEHGARRG